MRKRLPLWVVLAGYRDGDERGWAIEFEDLWSREAETMSALLADIAEHGIREPILLGDDGRVWDGHHRLAVAHRLNLPDVPIAYPYADREARKEQR